MMITRTNPFRLAELVAEAEREACARLIVDAYNAGKEDGETEGYERGYEDGHVGGLAAAAAIRARGEK